MNQTKIAQPTAMQIKEGKTDGHDSESDDYDDNSGDDIDVINLSSVVIKCKRFKKIKYYDFPSLLLFFVLKNQSFTINLIIL